MYFYPAFKLTVYAPRSIDPTETTPLTPVAGAPHADPFVVTTIQGVAGAKPYLDVPAGRTGTIDPVNKTTSVGTQVFRLLDSRVTAGGSNAQRWVTAFAGDGKGGNRFIGRKAIALQSFDNGATWEPTPYWVGRIRATDLDGKQWMELTVRDPSKDLEVDVFVGGPAAAVASYAHLAQVAPLGLLQDYGGFAKTTPLRGTTTAPAGGTRTPFGIDVDRTNGDLKRTLITQALLDVARATLIKTEKTETQSPKLYLRAVGGGAYSEFDVDQLTDIRTTSLTRIIARKTTKAGAAAAPAAGTAIEFYITNPTAKPSDRLPLLINDVDPIQYLRHLAAGYFGKLDAAGNPTHSVAINAASFDALDTGKYVPWRKRVTKVSKLNKEFEEVCRAYHFAYYFEGGALNIVSLRRSATLAPAATLVDADLVSSADELKWGQDGENAYTAVEGSFQVERAIEASELPKPFEPLPIESAWGYRDAPDVPAIGIADADSQSIIVPIVGPRAADVIPKTLKIDAAGFRVAVGRTQGSAEKWNGASRVDAIHAHFVDYAGEITGPFGLGPSYVDIVVRRASANVAAALQGRFVALNLSALPDPATNQRGGPRLAFVISRSEQNERIKLRLLDAGANAVALPPSIATPVATGGTSNVGIEAAVTLNASAEPARVSYAVTEQSVAVRPAEDDPRWTTGPLTDASATVAISNLPHGKRVWVRTRSEPTAGVGFKLPSAWAFPAGTGYVNTTSLNPPSGIGVSSPTATETAVTWTNGESWAEIEVLLVAGAAPGAWLDSHVIATLPSATTQYALGPFLTTGTQYTVGVRHSDPSTGVSTVVSFTFVAGGSYVLDPPEDPEGFCYSLGVGLLRTSLLGGSVRYGLAVKAIEFPSYVEFSEAIETGVLTGVYGAFVTVGVVESVSGEWTIWAGRSQLDRRRRKLRARHIRDGSTESAWTAEVVTDLRVWDPLRVYVGANVFERGVHTLGDVAPGGVYNGDLDVTGEGNFGADVTAPDFVFGVGGGGGGGGVVPVAVYDEVTLITSALASLKFVGTGVTASTDGADNITVTITGNVASVYGRTGAVVAVAGDYAAFYAQLSVANTFTNEQIVARAATGNIGFRTHVNADSNARWLVTVAGVMQWGPGNAVSDTNLYRSAAAVLRTDHAFAAASLRIGATEIVSAARALTNIVSAGISGVVTLSAQVPIEFGASGNNGALGHASFHDSLIWTNNLRYSGANDPTAAANHTYMRAAGVNNIAGGLVFFKGNATETGVQFAVFSAPTSTGAGAVPASLSLRFRVNGSGIVEVPGTLQIGADTTLFRSAANVLETDDTFDAVALRISGTEIVTSGRALQNIAGATIVGGVTMDGTAAGRTFAITGFNASTGQNAINVYTGTSTYWHDVIRGAAHATEANQRKLFYYNGTTFDPYATFNPALATVQLHKELIVDDDITAPDFIFTGAGGGGGGGVTPVTIKDEGTSITSALASLNFVGSGVTAATDGSDNITVTITGNVTSVFGRTGAVVAVAGDYAAYYAQLAVANTFTQSQIIDGGAGTARRFTLKHRANAADGLVLDQVTTGTPSPRVFIGNSTDATWITAYASGASLVFATGGAPGSSSGTARFTLTATTLTLAVALALGSNAISGVTSLGMNGALTGATTISASNNVTITSGDQSSTRVHLVNTGSGGKNIALVAGNVNVGNDGFTLWNHTDGIKLLYATSAGAVTLVNSLAIAGAFTGVTTIAASGQIRTTGAVSAGVANSTIIANASGQAQIWACGPNTSTSGTMLLVVARSDLTSSVSQLAITATGIEAAGNVKFGGALQSLVQGAAGNLVMQLSVTGDSDQRFQLTAAGKHSWGGGGAAVDTIMERTGAGFLNVTGSFQISGTFHLGSNGAVNWYQVGVESWHAGMGASSPHWKLWNSTYGDRFTVLSTGHVVGTGRFFTTHATASDNNAAFVNTHASGYGFYSRGGNGTNYLAAFYTYDDVLKLTLTGQNLVLGVTTSIDAASAGIVAFRLYVAGTFRGGFGTSDWAFGDSNQNTVHYAGSGKAAIVTGGGGSRTFTVGTSSIVASHEITAPDFVFS